MATSMVACGAPKPEISAATREVSSQEGVTYIDDEAIALAGSVRSAGMTEAEQLRADELRLIAVSAFDLINAERAARGLTAFTWDSDLELCAHCGGNLRFWGSARHHAGGHDRCQSSRQ